MTEIGSAVAAYLANYSNPNIARKTYLSTADQLPLALAKTPQDAPVVAIIDCTARQAVETAEFVKEWQNLLGVNRSWHVIAGELTIQELTGDVVSSSSWTIHHLLQSTPTHGFIIPITAIGSTIPDPETYKKRSLSLTVGEDKPQRSVLQHLVDTGYCRYESTLEPGGFRVRGEQVDIHQPTAKHPITISWLGSIIESITVNHNRRSNALTRISIIPTNFPPLTKPLIEHLTRAHIFRPAHIDYVTGVTTTIYDALSTPDDFPARPVEATTLAHHPCLIFYTNHDRVAAYITDHNLSATLQRHPIARFPFALRFGGITIASEAALIPATANTPAPLSYARGLELLAELTPGKPAVHADHGIGIYEGLQDRVVGEATREYLFLRYAAGDTLLVPVEYAHKVTPYVGNDTPPIHRLGGTGWSKVKRQAQIDAAAFAKELLATAGKRSASHGHRYIIQPAVEDELNQSFAYTLTIDQMRAWQDVREDLEGEHIMDRLIVGDVGFGKTEIAMRAARHAIANGKQVALLAPTTLLVQQHSDTWRSRFPSAAKELGVVSRFSTTKELEVTRKNIATGTVRMAIGTHGLLGESTTWENLGLVIIDEEQRFGVKHKEHFKTIRASVDFLSLSATPIPRTLSMALSGIKQLSVISTAPEGRLHVTTHVGRDTREILASALTAELARGGQAYVVAPKIRQLSLLQRRIKELLPSARVAMIHGQLPPQTIADSMRRFDAGELQIIVSSTIIENGIDLPNANTIIVTHATHFGLADLYQLRGRVGRRKKQGHAFFLYNQTELRGVQRQRLTALTEATALGSGWSLAQRDLEIRGAGNLLGAAQSGSVSAVGAQLYLDLVREAVADEHPIVRRHDVNIQLQLPTGFPEHYVADSLDRTTLYQQLSRAGSLTAVQACSEEIQRRYGPLPPEAKALVTLIRLQHVAARAGITHITSSTISPTDEDPYEKLVVHAVDLPRALSALGGLGNWEVKGNTLQLGVDRVDLELVQKLSNMIELLNGNE